MTHVYIEGKSHRRKKIAIFMYDNKTLSIFQLSIEREFWPNNSIKTGSYSLKSMCWVVEQSTKSKSGNIYQI